jgi:oligopeptide/dipeptide ABC transporter ATP-binding protein
LVVRDLAVTFSTEHGSVHAVRGVSFDVCREEVLAIVGESGCGKSVTVMTLMGLTRSPNAKFEGTAELGGLELVHASDKVLRRVRGAEIAIIFQEPMTALDPVQRVGRQIAEQIRAHDLTSSRRNASDRGVELMGRVGIAQPRERSRSYPHEFSGGMRQRVMIAMGLSCSPKILIADEPTTALDVTIQAQILEQLKILRAESGAGIVLVTHDLGVVAEMADRVAVMYAGQIVEEGTVDEVFYDPQHPYTWGLLGSIPRRFHTRDRPLPSIPGAPPSLVNPPAGCAFAPRCPHAHAKCQEIPPLEAKLVETPDHRDRCWLSHGTKNRLREVDGRIGLAEHDSTMA